MHKQVKRGVLTALILSCLAPFSGLLYVHKAVRALIFALITLVICIGIRAFDLFASFDVLLVCISIVGALWVVATLSSMLLARKGLTPETAQADIGPWIAGYLLTITIAVALLDTSNYKGYAISTSAMEPTLSVGDYVLSRRNPFGNGMPNPGVPRPGELVVVEDAHGRSFVRRIAGLAGDILEVRDTSLFRNGEKLLEAKGVVFPGQTTLWHVPANMVFVLADNPSNKPVASGPTTPNELSGLSAQAPGSDADKEDTPSPAALHAVAVNQSAIRGKVLYRYWGVDKTRLGVIE